jgi:hypothetical protein
MLDLVTPTPGRVLFGSAVTISYFPTCSAALDPERYNLANLSYEAVGDEPAGTRAARAVRGRGPHGPRSLHAHDRERTRGTTDNDLVKVAYASDEPRGRVATRPATHCGREIGRPSRAGLRRAGVSVRRAGGSARRGVRRPRRTRRSARVDPGRARATVALRRRSAVAGARGAAGRRGTRRARRLPPHRRDCLSKLSVCGFRVGYDRHCRWKAVSLARASIPACAAGAASAR